MILSAFTPSLGLLPKSTPTPGQVGLPTLCAEWNPGADWAESAYLLAEEEALGGEDSKAIRGRALRCTVCAGCLADFSLLLLVQSTELEHGPLGRGHTALPFLMRRPQASPIAN